MGDHRGSPLRDVAQPGSAHAWGAWGRRFKSCHPDTWFSTAYAIFLRKPFFLVLDILITYYQHQYVIELKLWRGQQAHENGLDQLADYLDSLGLDEGALLIFDQKGVKERKVEEVVWKGKRVLVVWVWGFQDLMILLSITLTPKV